MENKRKHLEMIQKVIERMANNSFLIKGWCITLIAAISALAINNKEEKYILVGAIPLISFWLLDSYYLYLEKCYRNLYDFVLTQKEEEITFGMSIYSSKIDKPGIFQVIFSNTNGIFYILLGGTLYFMGKIIN